MAKNLIASDHYRCKLEKIEDDQLGCKNRVELLPCTPGREPREAFQGPAYIGLSAADKLAKLRQSINACAGISGVW